MTKSMSDEDVLTQLIIAEVVSDLQITDVVSTDWSSTFCTAPGVIAILGECMILSCVPSASAVYLNDGHLETAALPTRLLECSQMGRGTFLSAQSGMHKIRMYASNVAPIVDRIIALLEQTRHSSSEKMLNLQIKSLQKCAETATEEAKKILRNFENWRDLTYRLALGLSGEKDKIVSKKTEKEAEIAMNKAQTRVAQGDIQEAGRALALQQDKLNELFALRERVLSGANLAMQSTLATSPTIGGAVLSVTGSAIVATQIAIGNARKKGEDRQKFVEKAEKEQEVITATLKKLHSEESSLEDIKAVLLKGIKRLLTLQTNVERLLIFFQSIYDQVQNLSDMYNDQLVAMLEFPELLTDDQKHETLREIRRTAFDVKVRFKIIQEIVAIYAEVSQRHILSGFDVIDMLSLSEPSIPGDGARDRHLALDDYRRTATAGIEQVTEKHKKELIDDLRIFVETSARGTIQKKIAADNSIESKLEGLSVE